MMNKIRIMQTPHNPHPYIFLKCTVSANTYHLYVKGVAMIPKGIAFQKILCDDNVQRITELE